jgi:N-glycosylase/DNA lyase
VNMSRKRYDEVSTKLRGVWGEYAGWAHSVNLLSVSGFN